MFWKFGWKERRKEGKKEGRVLRFDIPKQTLEQNICLQFNIKLDTLTTQAQINEIKKNK